MIGMPTIMAKVSRSRRIWMTSFRRTARMRWRAEAGVIEPFSFACASLIRRMKTSSSVVSPGATFTVEALRDLADASLERVAVGADDVQVLAEGRDLLDARHSLKRSRRA